MVRLIGNEKIYVDADACPVKDEITKLAIRNKISTYMVCNGGIAIQKYFN